MKTLQNEFIKAYLGLFGAIFLILGLYIFTFNYLEYNKVFNTPDSNFALVWYKDSWFSSPYVKLKLFNKETTLRLGKNVAGTYWVEKDTELNVKGNKVIFYTVLYNGLEFEKTNSFN